MNYQRNNMRYSGAVRCAQNAAELRGGNRPLGGYGDGGNKEAECLYGKSLAMVYSPCQEFDDLYDLTEGFKHGTIFRALDKPFLGKGGK